MSGFTKLPNDLAFDTRLGLPARLTYAALLHLAWKAGRRSETDGVEMGTLDDLADLVGCSRTAIKGYVTELRKAGWIATQRVANQGQLYFVFEKARAESDPELGRITARLRARAKGPKTKAKSEAAPNGATSRAWPPPLVEIAGQNLGWNALDRACQVNNPNRAGEIAAALNGGRNVKQGIRRLVADEIVRDRGLTQEEVLAVVAEDPERFERAVEALVERRARIYRERMPGANLTPLALVKWWANLETLPPDRRGVSGGEARRIAEDALRGMAPGPGRDGH